MKHRYDRYWEHNGFKIIECMDCGFKHVYPLPEKESMKKLTTTQYMVQYLTK